MQWLNPIKFIESLADVTTMEIPRGTHSKSTLSKLL